MIDTNCYAKTSVEPIKTKKFLRFFICLYFLIAFFEPYLKGALGAFGRYYIFFLMAILVLDYRKLRLQKFHAFLIAWLLYKFITAIWTPNSYIFELHLMSQIGMVALLVVLTAVPIDKKTIDGVIFSMWLGSFTIGFLSVFMSRPYHGEATARQVLYLFGQEADPNNQAAFLLVGLAIALNSVVFKKKKLLLSLATIIINSYSVFLTGSRGGLLGMICIVLFFILFGLNSIKFKHRLCSIFAIAIVAIVVYSVAHRFLPNETFLRLFDFRSYEGGSERSIIWKNGWELFSLGMNALFGAGWGAYYGYNGIFMAMHNTYLSILCDVGVLGFSLFFVPIVSACVKLPRKTRTLPILLLLSGLIPSFFIEAINKRFFWNVIIFLFMFYVNKKDFRESFSSNSELAVGIYIKN